MTFEEIYSVDTSDMYRLLKGFPLQVREAVEIGKQVRLRVSRKGVGQIVLTGLGGSAIAGDLLRDYLAGELKIPLFVNRQYTLPAFVGPNTLLIVSSYSGNTEETVSAHREAGKKRAKILCITSGGKVEKVARAKRQSLISIPGGYPPRTALGYSFFPLLSCLIKLGFIKARNRYISETIQLLEKKSQEYGIPDPSLNRALQLAEILRGRLAVVYAGERFASVATRWRGQVAENGKALMFGHVLPEMNHNEIVGWKYPEEIVKDFAVLFLRDKGDHPRVHRRMELTRQIVSERTPHIVEVWSEGSSASARMLSLIYLGDWVSYYLAVLQREDPTPVKVIDYLKGEMGRQ